MGGLVVGKFTHHVQTSISKVFGASLFQNASRTT